VIPFPFDMSGTQGHRSGAREGVPRLRRAHHHLQQHAGRCRLTAIDGSATALKRPICRGWVGDWQITVEHAHRLWHVPVAKMDTVSSQIPSINQQQSANNQHHNCRTAMYAERDGPATALPQHDHGVSDRDQSGD
jgi:hypothetical protein